MQLIRGLYNLASPLPASAVTIGNFDGVHRGHQLVIEQLKRVASLTSLPTVVIIFEPQPIEFFAPERAPKRLARFREKIAYLKAQQIDYLLCLHFNDALAEQSAEEFVQNILLKNLNTRHLVIGDDFHFGKNRQGNFEFLMQNSARFGFTVDETETLMLDGERVSSTRIRHCIEAGDFEKAAELLGRPYSLSGRVAHGKKLGRELGYPTINIKMGDKTLIVKGIFAVRVKGIDNRVLEGVASIGTRPTVAGVDTILEVYILDFDQDVYGCSVVVEFLHKIRDEKKFDSLEELTENIARDTENAMAYFSKE
ncbi:MAG: bifunctional riboflavin kinase/FAD synthetase [Gammaproteobacteria bacterium]|nr:MAG: bifunctional riboflavin kinase/FAD synthetase [Gammaproteobacteria bacterium]UCH39355.1 MAG: bifunctional riboflavin kinase/FAD synthetase [Gammaproteobacteria bacterium]